MNTGKIEEAINALPNNVRLRFLKKLWRQHEDACDLKIREEALKEGGFELWKDVKKELHANHHHRQTRKAVLKKSYRRKTSSSTGR